MSFKQPEFLYLLFAILIPIIIHLFNFRRYKKLWFSNIEFLKNITSETRKQNKLKHRIVLLTRILAIIFLVMAFAQPQPLSSNKQQATSETKNLTIAYIDNSFSMMAEGENGRLFDQAINVSREIINNSPRDSRFSLLNNETGYTRKLLTREAVLSELDVQKISPGSRQLSSVIRSAQRIASEKEYDRFDLFLLSDFQENTFDIASFPEDSTAGFYFMPFEYAQKRNIYIDSCWTAQPVIMPGKPVQFFIRIRNASETQFEKIPLKVTINDQQKAVAGVDLKAGSFEDISVTLTPGGSGWHLGLIEIEDYPITFDDIFYFAFKVNDRVKVLEIGDDSRGDELRQFYSSDSIFLYKQVNYRQINYNRLNENNLIILNSLPGLSTGLSNQIKDYLGQGGNVLLIPNTGTTFEDENLFLRNLRAGRIVEPDTSKTRVVRIKGNHELFSESILKLPDNADLPFVNQHLKINYSIADGMESLVSMLDGDDFLLTKNVEDGRFYLLSVPLSGDYSNFTSHALFVPVMYGIATQGGSKSRLSYSIAIDEGITYDPGPVLTSESPFVLKNNRQNYQFIPEQKMLGGKLVLNIHNGINTDGFYQLIHNDSVFNVFAFNFNREESEMTFVTPESINDQLLASGIRKYKVIDTAESGYSETIVALQKESELWKLFIIFALLMLLAEVLILRFWK